MDHLKPGDLLILKADGWLVANMPTTGQGYNYAGTSLQFYPRLPDIAEDWKPTEAADFARWGVLTNGQQQEAWEGAAAALSAEIAARMKENLGNKAVSLVFRPKDPEQLSFIRGFVPEEYAWRSMLHYQETPKKLAWIHPVPGYDGCSCHITIVGKGDVLGLLVAKNRKMVRFTGIGSGPFAGCEFSVCRKKKLLTTDAKRDYGDEFISPDDLF